MAAAASNPIATASTLKFSQFCSSYKKDLGMRLTVILSDLDMIALFLKHCPKTTPLTCHFHPEGYPWHKRTVQAQNAKFFDIWASPEHEQKRFETFIALMKGETPDPFSAKLLTQGPVLSLTQRDGRGTYFFWGEGPAYMEFPVNNLLELHPRTHTNLSTKQECLDLAAGTKVMIHSFDIGSLSWKTESFKIPEKELQASCGFYKLPFDLLGESLFIEAPRRRGAAALLGRLSKILPSIVRR